jgi:pilus assembly protein CpaB
MNRSRMFLLAAVAFLVAIGVAAFTYQVLTNRMKPIDDTTQIVVANLPVQVGSKLTEADVRLASWPKSNTIDGAFHNVSEVIDRGVLVSMVPNEPVLASKLAAEGSGAGLMSAIPEGMRIVSVKVNDVSGVAGFVIPGSRVDVILSGSPTSGAIEMAKTFLENIQVLAAGQNVTSDDNGRPMNVQTVTLVVTPQQSEALALASVDGRLHLALRNPLDLAETKPPAIRREHLFQGIGSGGITPPPPAAAAPKPVRVPAPRKLETPPPAPPPVAPPPPQAPPPPVSRKKIEVQVIQGNQQQKLQFDAKEDTPAQQ